MRWGIATKLEAAALFAATVSTLSANLSSAATALTADFVLKFRPGLSPEAQMRWGRAFTFAAGILGIVAALVLAHADTRSLFDKFKEFISVLTAGLAGLFFLGVSPPVIAEEKQDGTVAPKPVAEALTEVEQNFEAETVTTGVRELTMVLQPGETAKLKDFDKLEKLDATGSTNYEELRDWGLLHPEVALLYTLPLPTGQVLDSTAHEVDLTGIQSDQVAETAGLLVYMP